MKKFLAIVCFVLLSIGANLPRVSADESETLEHLAVTIMQPAIKSAVNIFYGQNINFGDSKITDITAYNGAVFFDVTVETTTYTEKKILIGRDKIIFFVDVYGSVYAEWFEHNGEKTVAEYPKRTHVDYGIEATPNNEMTKDQRLDALTRVLVISEVQNAVYVFYAPYLSRPSMNAYNGYEIVSAKIDELIVTITPYVGAHNSIGKEKITMEIWKDGAVFVTDYEHLNSYSIVPWLKDSLKKPLPKGTED